MKKLAAVLVVVGAITLLATAGFHATGYGVVSREIAASSVAPFVKQAVPTLWLFFSWHLVAVGVGVVSALVAFRSVAGPIALACAVVVAVDFVWVYSIAGLFAGSILLLLASVCLAAGGWLLSRGR